MAKAYRSALFGLLGLCLLAVPSAIAAQALQLGPSAPERRQFAPYVDVSLPNSINLAEATRSHSGVKAFILGFLVSNGGCHVGWGTLGGALPTDTMVDGKTSVRSIIQALQKAGKSVTVSFGGDAGSDPAGLCPTPEALKALYQSVLDTYHVDSLDFDFEGIPTGDIKANARRNKALILLRRANPNLVVSFTLPVMPYGLVPANGLNVINGLKADGFDPDIINLMAMRYGIGGDEATMVGLTIDAVKSTREQLKMVGLSSKIGVTPMIERSDRLTETFRLPEAKELLAFAQAAPYVARLSMWSIGRDHGNCLDASAGDQDCRGLEQQSFALVREFSAFK